ncbi:bacterial-type signalling protein, putative [Bodo saltans]|uniref:Bacterial-type signalling protein, putative n=1 Tax=Bodo saltans TaxID=75058 RepID=A0A0S4IXF0_BODSA|nr:bacterial-type signalling protein, putative [Bodo saltans]|eukprot:CUG07593.1 bacterial-type signalling protein, putative [Bodo saltans]
MSSLTMTWSPALIFISYGVSVQAAYTALQILQMRISRWLIAIAALCLSVSGIWAMHFIGMAAMSMDAEVSYDIGWTVASVLFAYFPTFAAFLLLDATIAAAQESGEEEEDTRDISIDAHIRALRRAPHPQILLGGALIALGVCLMHYLGMHSMEVKGMVRVMNYGVIVASVIIALGAGTAALYFAFVLPATREYTIPTALVAGVAVCGMHYCGMYGIRYENESMVHSESSSSIESAILYIVFASSAVSSASLALSSYLYRKSLREAADDAEGQAALILAGRFDELGVGPSEQSERVDPIMARLKRSNALLGEQMQKLMSFLPPSLLAQFEAARDKEALEEGDDEGDIMSADLQEAHNKSSGDMNASKTDLNASKLDLGASRLSSNSTGTHRTLQPQHRHQYDVGMEQRAVGALQLSQLHRGVTGNGVRFLGMYASFIDGLTKVAKAHKGVLDVVHGDRVLMTFNTSMKNASYARSCATAAVHLAKDVGAPGGSGCVSIGVATGTAKMGNIGSKSMMRYTICGPAISHAYKCQELAYELHDTQGTHIIGLVNDEMRMSVRTRAVDVVQWKHMPLQMIASEVVSLIEGDADEWMYELEASSEKDPFHNINNAFKQLLAPMSPTTMATTTDLNDVLQNIDEAHRAPLLCMLQMPTNHFRIYPVSQSKD